MHFLCKICSETVPNNSILIRARDDAGRGEDLKRIARPNSRTEKIHTLVLGHVFFRYIRT
jgi:hypothetical protein